MSDEISFKELIYKIREWFNYLLTKWIIIVVVGLLGGILGYMYARSKKHTYTATTTFVLEDSNSGNSALNSIGGLASMVGVDVGSGGGIFQGDNIIELYKSRTMIEKTLLTHVMYEGSPELLIDHYIKFNKLRENWSKDPFLKNINFKNIGSFTRVQDSILGSIVSNIKINYLNVAKPDKKLNIIKVEVKTSDEFFSKNFNDQIVKNVNDFYIQTKMKKSLENLAILQHQTDSVKAVLNGTIYSSAAVVDATPNLNPTRQILRVPIQRSQYNAEANKAILIQLVQNLELSKLSLRKEMPLIQVLDHPIYPIDREVTSKLKGIFLGGLLFGFIAVIFFSLRMVIIQLLK